MKHMICSNCGYRLYGYGLLQCPFCRIFMTVEGEDAA